VGTDRSGRLFHRQIVLTTPPQNFIAGKVRCFGLKFDSWAPLQFTPLETATDLIESMGYKMVAVCSGLATSQFSPKFGQSFAKVSLKLAYSL
jgi:hypothetical protein